VFLGLGVLDVADTVFKQATGVSRLEGRYLVEYAAFLGFWLVGAAVLLRVRDGRLLGAFGVLYFPIALYMSMQSGVLVPRLGGG
jgi:hypothetical protein